MDLTIFWYILYLGLAIFCLCAALAIYVLAKFAFYFLKFYFINYNSEMQKLPRTKGWFDLFELFNDDGITKVLQQFNVEGKMRPFLHCGGSQRGENSIFFTKPDTIKELIVEERFPKLIEAYEGIEDMIGHGLVVSTGELWKRQRRIITPIFHFSNLKDMVGTMYSVSDRWIEQLRGSFNNNKQLKWDPFESFSACTLEVIIDSVFSGELDLQDFIWRWNRNRHLFQQFFKLHLTIGRILANILPFPFTVELKWHLYKMRKSIYEVIQQRKRKMEDDQNSAGTKSHDLLNCLLNADEKMEDQLIIDEVITFAFAGHDTTSTLLSWTTYFLALNQNVQQELRNQLDNINIEDVNNLENCAFLKACLKEAIRLRPPVPFIDRQCKEDTELAGIKMKKNTAVFLFIMAAHLDPEYWGNDANEYNPYRWLEKNNTRPTYSFVPFSAGSRNCVGQKFAMLEAQVLLGKLVKNFKFTLDTSSKVTATMETTLGPKGLKLFLEKN